LFVEDNDPSTKFEKMKWNIALTNESNIFKLHINVEEVKGKNENGECNLDVLVVIINKTKTLADLKAKVSAKTGVPVDQFKIHRKHVIRDFRNLKATMTELGITNGALLQI